MSLCHVCGLRNSENLAGQRSCIIIIIARKEGGAWERTPQDVDIGARTRERRRMDAEVDGAGAYSYHFYINSLYMIVHAVFPVSGARHDAHTYS